MPRRSTPTVHDAVQMFFASRSNLAENTSINDRSVLNQFIVGVGRDKSGRDKQLIYLTPHQLERWFVSYVGPRNRSAASYNKVRQRVWSFLAYTARHGWTASPEQMLADVRKRKTAIVEKARLAPHELLAILESVTDARDRGVLTLAGNSGLRSGEIISLKVRDVYFETNEIYLYRSKSYQDDRLAMTPLLRTELMRWLAAYRAELAERAQIDLHGDMYLFPWRTDRKTRYEQVPDGTHRSVGMVGDLVPYEELQKPFRVAQRWMERFGIEPERGQGMHVFRRSAARAFFGSLVERGGYDSALRATMVLLGHASSVTTEGYLGVSFDRRRRNELLTAQDFLPVRDATVIPLRAINDTDA